MKWTGIGALLLAIFAAHSASAQYTPYPLAPALGGRGVVSPTVSAPSHPVDGQEWITEGEGSTAFFQVNGTTQQLTGWQSSAPYATDVTKSNVFGTIPDPYGPDWAHNLFPGTSNNYNIIMGVGPNVATGAFDRVTAYCSLCFESNVSSDDTVGVGQGVFRNAYYTDRDTGIGTLSMSWLGAPQSVLHTDHQDIWDYYVPATTFTGSISGTVLTVASGLTGTVAVGQYVTGNGVNGTVTITSFGTGTGGTGTYHISSSQSVSSESLATSTYAAPGTSQWNFQNLESLDPGTGAAIAATADAASGADVIGDSGDGRDSINQLHLGTYNTATGYKACGHSYWVNLNTCTGAYSGYNAVFTYDSVFDGAHSGQWNIDGNGNFFGGYQAGQYPIHAIGDVIVGDNAANNAASFQATISGTNMTVTGTVTGLIQAGQTVTDGVTPSAVTNGTTVVSQTSGTTGGDGVYVVSQSSTVSSSTAMTSQITTLDYAIMLGDDVGDGLALVNNELLINVGGKSWHPAIRADMANAHLCIECVSTQALLANLTAGNGDAGLGSLNSYANDLYVTDNNSAGMTIAGGTTGTENIVLTSTDALPFRIATTAASGNTAISSSGTITVSDVGGIIFSGTMTMPDGSTWPSTGPNLVKSIYWSAASALQSISATGQATIGTGTTSGLVMEGKGSTDDLALEDGGTHVLNILTGHTTISLPNIASDTGKTDGTVCEDTTNHELFSGSGTLGVCLGTSSARFKRDIVSDDLGLSDLLRWKVKCWRYKKGYGDGGRHRQCGLIAEDLIKVTPSLVGLDRKGRPNTVDWAGEIPIMIKSIQEEQKEISFLKREIENLRHHYKSAR